jgi:hypothetical protein
MLHDYRGWNEARGDRLGGAGWSKGDRTGTLELKGKRERKKEETAIKEGGEMATLGIKEKGRKERAKSLPPPRKRAAQRWWRSLTEEVENQRKRKTFSHERKESYDPLNFV